MPRRHHTADQILVTRRETEVALSQGLPVAQACWIWGITEQPYCRWCNEYGGWDNYRGQMTVLQPISLSHAMRQTPSRCPFTAN